MPVQLRCSFAEHRVFLVVGALAGSVVVSAAALRGVLARRHIL